MFSILILQVLILQGGANITILPKPTHVPNSFEVCLCLTLYHYTIIMIIHGIRSVSLHHIMITYTFCIAHTFSIMEDNLVLHNRKCMGKL